MDGSGGDLFELGGPVNAVVVQQVNNPDALARGRTSAPLDPH
jgi:hypothetical protein